MDKLKFKNNKTAFTLAEVLITIVIIGVIAVLTIPVMIQKYQEKQTIVQLKKSYSILENAFRLAVTNYGTPDEWTDDKDHLTILSEYLKLDKNCKKQPGCFYDGRLKRLHGAESSMIPYVGGYYMIRLADGTQIASKVSNKDCKAKFGGGRLGEGCFSLMVDTNGNKGPNQSGVDVFGFFITKTAVIPEAPYEFGDQWVSVSFPTYCDKKSTHQYNGGACTGWVLANENMDYLHCSGLSWKGAKKCGEPGTVKY